MQKEKVVSLLIITSSSVLKRQAAKHLASEKFKIDFIEKKEEVETRLKVNKFNILLLDADFFKKSLLDEIKKIRKSLPRIPIFIIGSPVKDQNYSISELHEEGIDEYFERTDIWTNSSLIKERAEYYVKHGKKSRSRKLTKNHSEGFSAILIGASTGGPQVLKDLIYDLPPTTPPLLIVQHIDQKFSESFFKRMCLLSGLKPGKITEGTKLEPGHLYMPTSQFNIGVKKVRTHLCLTINRTKKLNAHIPSVDFLFNSAVNLAEKICAILLTGLGNDGSRAMSSLHKKGALTMAQDEGSSPVFGMPEEAIKLGAVDFVGNPSEIRAKLLSYI